MITLKSSFPELNFDPRQFAPAMSKKAKGSGLRRSAAVHFIGIGGIGMSALARWFLALSRVERMAHKTPVSGSDLVKSPITKSLVKEGAGVKIGHNKRHLRNGHGSTISPQVGLVIYSKAAKPDNPELREARRLRIPALSYSEAVGRLTSRYKTIAVAGAHGKSTTTALASLILKKAGLDPTVIIGTNLREFGGKNFRAGRGEWLVLEADEFGKSFLDYSPALSVVTNIDLEHLDTYKNLADVKNSFFKFLSNTRRGGVLALNKDSKNLYSLAPRIRRLAKKNDYRVLWYSLRGNTAKKIRRVIKIPGEHNIANAVAAYKAGRVLGISHKKILSAIGSYRGSWRRMEYKGDIKLKTQKSKIKIGVFDDYAHHPAEIIATLKAFRKKYHRSPIVCVYQPHQALRLKKLWRDFITAFGDTDVLIIIPMYQVAGRDKIDPRFTSKTLAAAINRRLTQNKRGSTQKVYYLANPRKIKSFLAKIIKNNFISPRKSASGPRQSAILIMMGAGNIADYTPSLLRRR